MPITAEMEQKQRLILAAINMMRERRDDQELTVAALEYARAREWLPPAEATTMRKALDAHTDCRINLQKAMERVDELELAIASVIGARASASAWASEELDEAITSMARAMIR